MIRWNIWTLDVDCNPAGKRSWRFCGRRLNTSKSQIRLFMKNLVLKISRHQRNTQPWKNFHNWPGFITTFTKLSSHYGWSQNHKAEQTLQLITTFTKLSSHYGWSLHSQSWAVVMVDHKTTRLSRHYSWSLHSQSWAVVMVDTKPQVWAVITVDTTSTSLSSHYGWSPHAQGWAVITAF